MPCSARPGGRQTRTGMPDGVVTVGVNSYGPTVNATRYEEIFGVSRKRVRVRRSSRASWDVMGMFPIAAFPAGWISSSEKVALNSGSSKHGNARLASAASNCVAAERSVQTAQRVADPALPGDLQDVLPSRYVAREMKRCGLGLRVQISAFELV